MSEARSPKITILVEPAERALIDDRPGPRLCKGIRIDDVAYYLSADDPIAISTQHDNTIAVTLTLLANDVQFETVE